MSEQKFYRTVVTYEILSYTPLGEQEIGSVIDDCTYGEYSGLELTRVEEVVNAVRIKELMIAQGSDPAFLLGDGK